MELEDGHVVNACGLTEAQKEEFTEAVLLASRNAYGYEQFPTMPNWGLSADLQGDVVNPMVGWAVEVAFMERFKDGSLRHPTFNRWRGWEVLAGPAQELDPSGAPQARRHVLADFRDQFMEQLHESQLEKMPEIPKAGTLDLRLILESDFAFA